MFDKGKQITYAGGSGKFMNTQDALHRIGTAFYRISALFFGYGSFKHL